MVMGDSDGDSDDYGDGGLKTSFDCDSKHGRGWW
jgi:hypothetical protein